MKIENAEMVQVLIEKRQTLQGVLKRSGQWTAGHFEFVSHYGDDPDREVLDKDSFKELNNKFLGLIREEIKVIEDKLKDL